MKVQLQMEGEFFAKCLVKMIKSTNEKALRHLPLPSHWLILTENFAKTLPHHLPLAFYLYTPLLATNLCVYIYYTFRGSYV